MSLSSVHRLAFAASVTVFAALFAAQPAAAQVSMPPGQVTAFKDTSILKPPPGAKVAIVEFEDLECPACARAFPLVRAAVERYHIPLLHHDFPLQMHIWSFDAAVTARYLQDKVSPKVAEEFRRDVFTNQNSIASKDDLANYTRRWFEQHGQKLPFVIDPSGLFTAEVRSDYTLGERLGVMQTPTIVVVTPHGWIQVMEVNQLYSAIDKAEAEEASSSSMRSNVRKSTAPAR